MNRIRWRAQRGGVIGRLAVLEVAVIVLLAAMSAVISPNVAKAASPLVDQAEPTGYGLVASGSVLAIPPGCGTVATGTEAVFGAVAVMVVNGTTTSTISVGTQQWSIQPGQTFSTVAWTPLTAGGFQACVPTSGLNSASLTLLAYTTTPNTSAPGGLVNVTARIPLATQGTTSGQWAIPPDATPDIVGGVMLQVSSSTSDLLDVTAGNASISVVVGPNLPAQTLILPSGPLSWTGSSGVAPDAVFLGFLTDPSDGTTGGALLNLLPTPKKVSGTSVIVAGMKGIPNVGSQIPVTSLLTSISGDNPSVMDPLAAGRQTATGASATIPTMSLLRVASDGSINLSTESHLLIYGWLAGDEIRNPQTIDLTLSGSPTLQGKPTPTTLVFKGTQNFPVGSTLVLGVSKHTPNGLIAIVDSVVSSGLTTTVTYHTGELLDAFSELTLVGQIPAAPVGQVPQAQIYGSQASTLAPITEAQSLGFTSSKSFKLGASVSASVGFQFAPAVTVAVTVGTGFLGLPSSLTMHYAVDATSSLTASLTAQAGFSGQATVGFPTLYLPAFDLGPVVVVPDLTSSLNMSAALQASVSLSGTIYERAHVGMTMTAGGSRGNSVYGDSNNGFGAPSFSGASLESSITAEAQATLTFQFNLLAYGQVGPDAQANASIDLKVNPGSTPLWAVTASGNFGIGFNLNALNIHALTDLLHLLGISTDPTWTIGHLGPYTVASNTGSTGGGSPSGGGGSGGGSGSGPGGTGGGGGGGSGGGPLTPAPAGASATMSQGPVAPYGYRYQITLHGYVPNTTTGVTCFDSADPGGFYYFELPIDANGNASTSSYCYSATGPNYWFVAGGLSSNVVQWTTSGSPPAPGAAIQIGWSSSHPGWIYMTLTGFPGGSYQYTCQFASGGNGTFTVGISGSPEMFDNGQTCYDLESGDTVSVSIDDVQSNSIIVGGTPPQKGTGETTGGVTNTWSNYANAGGTQGPTIQSNETVAITCRVQGFAVADGNTWWYLISSSPWSDQFYASADAFYNNGQTSGSLIGTPFVDTSVPTCAPPPPPTSKAETTGGVTNTWTNYTNAGGIEGPQIGTNVTVQITCALQGFRVADGNTWWYQIGSSPWNNQYYASADAFYNNGQTSGSLKGTPFVDPAVPLCSSGISETTGGQTNTWSNYSNGGGTQGPTIGGHATVTVTCAVQGFRVADGNTWWYRIGSPTWGNQYYASADAFYNNGQTTGSLIGTPFVDPAVPLC
jgi:hypothetical protein